MSTQSVAAPVRASITVDAPADRAFEFFTAEMGAWWPKEHHVLQGELSEMVLEPRAGGRIYDRGTDGSECCWARVLARLANIKIEAGRVIRAKWNEWPLHHH